MRHVLVTACGSLIAMAGVAAGDSEPPPSVIGGKTAPAGKWPDVAAVLFPSASLDKVGCTGTLVAPTVVLTAGHCADPAGTPPDNVLIGTSSLARPGDGETIAIARHAAFPDAIETEDVAVLVLAAPSSRAPRAIATGWARFDIVNGAAVALVGFGATNRDGDLFVDELQEGSTTITDADCSTSSGCNTAARPAGELGAGGMGVDTCPRDSGGPLYLVTGHGSYLAGITSRAYENAMYACSGGGIYTRPDKLIDWIETAAGVPVTHGPVPTAELIVAVRRDLGHTQIEVNDPASDAHRFAITTPPAHGFASVNSAGVVTVCTVDASGATDQLAVTVTDAHNARRALALAIEIRVEDGVPPIACTEQDVAIDNGGCCDSGGRSGGALPLAIAVLAVVLRRRRVG